VAERLHDTVTTCLLAGGEGRRVNGQDKGLLMHEGRPLADWVLQQVAPQSGSVLISANRHIEVYTQLHRPWAQVGDDSKVVWPDDADLPPHSGPLAGIITLLRRVQSDWAMVVPCDTPHLPGDLVARLLSQAQDAKADIVVPQTQKPGEAPRLHWVCALVNKRVCPETQALFVQGERKVGNWVRSQNWSSVSFADDAAFTNMNTLETLHGRA